MMPKFGSRDIEHQQNSLEALQSKSVSAFVTEITPRLLKAFPDRYNTTTTSGK
jgi:hypothetical protein